MTAPSPAGLSPLLDQLDEARAKGTPGPWEVEICEGELTVSAGTARTTWTDHDGFRLGSPASSYRSTDRIYEHELDDWDADSKDDRQREADADLIVAAVNALPQLTAALRAVLDVHGAIDAVQYLSTRQVPRRVCTGCGSDDGNWQAWPCPTVRALTAALTPGADTAGATA